MTREANDEAVRRLKDATDDALAGVLLALDSAGKPGKNTIVAMRTAISRVLAEVFDAGIAFERAKSAPPPPEDADDPRVTRPGFRFRRSNRPPT